MVETPAFRLRNEPNLAAKLKAFPYQEEAVEFVASRDFAAIFHEQGLGKTKIAIDTILRWLADKEIDTALVVTKKGLIENWRREFALHSHLSPLILSDDSTKNYYVFTTPTRLVLCHFEVARKEERRLKAWLQTRRVAIFIDESAKIKNPDTSLTQVYHHLSPHFAKRVIMTGTPVANRPYDIWSQIFFLDQGVALGTDYSTFKRDHDFDKLYATDQVEFRHYQLRLASVFERVAKISIRETKDGGRIVLPTKEFSRIQTNWESGQRALYQQVKEELRAVVLRDGKLIEDGQESILKRLLRLIQIASHPRLVDEGYGAEPGKLLVLRDLITDITRQNEKVIVWTSFIQNAEWLAKALSPFGALALHGKLPMDRRNAAVKWFMENPNDRVLVATPGAAKEGLTLTVANHVIFYDRTYSLDDYLQAQDRIHRVSQVRKCYVYNLIMPDSVDEWVDSLLEEKRLAARLTQGDIVASEYAESATLSFYEILQQILN